MSLRWAALEEHGQFRALELHGIRGRPAMRLELAAGSRMRVVARAGPLLWARIGRWREHWARLSRPGVHPRAVAKIAAPAVRAAPGAAGSDPWWAYWSRHFARALGDSDDTPLYPGPWWLEPVRAGRPARPWWDASLPLPARWEAVIDDLGVRQAEPLQMNQVVPLRRASPLTADRVKVWRKHARAGTLPPVLLWYLPAALEVFLVLDGHDRLRAAAAEKMAPRFLTLAPAQVVEQPAPNPHRLALMMEGLQRAYDAPGSRRRDLQSINTAVIDAHRTSHRRVSARAWPLPGGARAWEKEVRAACDRLGVSPEVIGLLGPPAP